MNQLLHDCHRYIGIMGELHDRWHAYLRAYDWDTRTTRGDAYELAAQEHMCFVADLESRYLSCIVDRIDQIAYRHLYGASPMEQ